MTEFYLVNDQHTLHRIVAKRNQQQTNNYCRDGNSNFCASGQRAFGYIGAVALYGMLRRVALIFSHDRPVRWSICVVFALYTRSKAICNF